MLDKNTIISTHAYDDGNETDISLLSLAFIVMLISGGYLLFAFVTGGDIRLVLLFFSLVFITFIVMAIRWNHRKKHLAINLYENGLEYNTKNKTVSDTWSSFQIILPKIWQKLPGMTFTYKLKHVEGKVITIDKRYTDYEALVNHLIENLLQSRHYVQLYNKGETVQIDTVRVNQGGIQIANQELIVWEDISNIATMFDKMQIVLANGTAIDYSLANTPDAPLLLALLVIVSGQATSSLVDRESITKPQLAGYIQSGLIRANTIQSLLFWVAILAVGIYVYGTGIRNLMIYEYEMASFDRWFILMSAAGLLAPIAATWMIVKRIPQLFAYEVITVDDSGLHYQNRQAKEFWHWEQIQGGQLIKDFEGNQVVYDVRLDDERTVRIHSRFQRYGDVINNLQRFHTVAHYDNLKAQLEAGEVLNFSPLTLDQFGIRYDGKSYQWEDIHHFVQVNEVGQDSQFVWQDENAEKLFSLGVFGVYNPALLHSLLDEKINGNEQQFIIE